MTEEPKRQRIEAIDFLRGAVIVLMALDHVRDFFGPTPYRPEDLTQASPALFLTRWVTHFCAPVFVFLAGLGARLYLDSGRTRGEVSRFLLSRGLLLVVLELTVINLSWLMFIYANLLFVQVIWVLGVSMILLAALLWLPRWAQWVLAIGVIATHNLLDGVTPGDFEGVAAHVWGVLHSVHWIQVSANFGVYVVYPLIPWFAVMLLGFASGDLMQGGSKLRRRRLAFAGAATTALFFVLRAVNAYGGPWPWATQERGGLFTVLSFLNTQKYPPSLLFLTMTLGPALLLLAWLDGRRLEGRHFGGRTARVLIDFGRVPMFFYLAHIPLIHVFAAAQSWLSFGRVGWWFQSPATYPVAYSPSLVPVYLVWIVVVALLWPACRAYGRLKQRSGSRILRFF